MKRRKFLASIGLLPPMLQLASCKSNFPSTPTIVTGKVTYEDGSPVEGAELRFSGTKRQGVSGSSVFSEIVYTDAAGQYSVSYVVPKECDFVEFAIEFGTLEEPTPAYGYGIYLSIDGVYQKQVTAYTIPYDSYGKTNTLDYQFREIIDVD